MGRWEDGKNIDDGLKSPNQRCSRARITDYEPDQEYQPVFSFVIDNSGRGQLSQSSVQFAAFAILLLLCVTQIFV